MSDQFVNSFAIKSISSMYLNSEYADVHFTFPNDEKNERVPAHKNILATVSKVFAAMFYGPLKEADIVEVTDSNSSAFKEFLQLIYLSEIKFTMENVREVVRLSDKYDMLDCVGACVSFLESQVTNENLVSVYHLAILLENSKLKVFCEKLIRVFAKDVLKSEAFLQCEQKELANFLKLDELKCTEADLFDACIKWATLSCRKNGISENDPKNLKKQLGDCFYLIRFGAMAEKVATELLSTELYKHMFTFDELADFVRISYDKNFKSEIFKYATRLNTVEKPITCQRTAQSVYNCYLMTERESSWFSVNEPVILTRIHFGSISYSNNTSSSFKSDVEIVEINSMTFSRNAPSKVLAKHINCMIGGGYNLSLTSPITIVPQKIYEISVVNAPANFYYYSKNILVNEIKLNEDITVTFHQDPSDVYGDHRNLVSKLEFLQLS